MGKKQVRSDSLWATLCCGVTILDVNNNVNTRFNPREEEEIYYFKGDCPSCGDKRPEMVDVVSEEDYSEQPKPRTKLTDPDGNVIDVEGDNDG